MTLVAKFEIHYRQFIDEQGAIHGHLPEFAQDRSMVVALYRTMVLTRLFDKKAIVMQRTGKMGTYAPVHGQEAIGAAVGQVLKTSDYLVPYYRDYAAQIQRGVLLSEILAYWGGDERGNQFQSGSSDFPMCVPIASQCLHAAGVAFAMRYKKEPRVVLVSIGDGGTSEGDFYEAMNVAGLWKLPLVFVINNNRWAISVPLHQQTRAPTLAQKAIAAGFEGVQVDGNDVIACHQAINEAVEKARQGEGPTLIEALTYRLSDHTTADDATRYQPSEERHDAQAKEPLKRFKQFLMIHHHWSAEEDQLLTQSCEDEVQMAVNDYLNRPPQSIASAFDYHYATLPDYLIEQRATALEEESVNA